MGRIQAIRNDHIGRESHEPLYDVGIVVNVAAMQSKNALAKKLAVEVNWWQVPLAVWLQFGAAKNPQLDTIGASNFCEYGIAIRGEGVGH